MNIKVFYTALIILVLITVLLSCTENTTIIRPIDGDAVHLFGVVYAWRCYGPNDYFNNPTEEHLIRFSMKTGEPAKITFIRDNGFESYWETDDSSSFERYMSAGTYIAVVETGYTWPPDTFYNIHLTPGDTTLRLDIGYDVIDPLHLTFAFQYPTINDLQPVAEEFDAILKTGNLARRIHFPGPLNILYTMSPDTYVTDTFCLRNPDGPCWVYHEVPVIRELGGYGELWNVLDAYHSIMAAKESDTTGVVPANLSLHPTGSYFCLH